MTNQRIRHEGLCPIEHVIDVFCGKWKPAIIYALEIDGKLRFNALRRVIPGVSQRMLTQQLRQLERDGIVFREHFPEIPPRVEYSLTELGKTFAPIGESLAAWRDEYMTEVQKARAEYDKKSSSA
ncbi:MAG: helix-turn-helix transcriptional regulator [Deltaproteobacteria bacterium]|nr:helix-turn-helix transcriptional regulator [Deltaproteobacteria bacterium]